MYRKFDYFCGMNLIASKQNIMCKPTNENIVNNTYQILQANQNAWQKRYLEYAEEILKMKDDKIAFGRLFQTKKSLHIYSTTTQSVTEFQIRFAGKKVGIVKYDSQGKNGKVYLTVNNDNLKVAKALGYNGKAFNKEPWRDKIASDYRSFFNKIESTNAICNTFANKRLDAGKEARIENKLLVALKKGDLIRNINPVLLCGAFFQFATPITASDHTKCPKYSGANGGGIDILARINHGSNRYDNRLAVIEVKDSHKDDTQAGALQQAIAYATFLAYLLKVNDNCGNKWWNIFGKGKNVPVELHIDAVTLMPEDANVIEGNMDLIEISGLKAYIHPYALYYKEDVDGNPSGFSGNLKDEIDPSPSNAKNSGKNNTVTQ